ncbi:MAG: hypothetical protein K2X47_18410 [Bdellovibrionales bacterium]|nr:hypothetical protein [Bdellovibrionales bacterium]
MKKSTFLFLVLFLPMLAASEALLGGAIGTEKCPQQISPVTLGNVLVYHFQSRDQCLIYLTPAEKSVQFRSYAFGSNGLFQIFNSFDIGDESTSTGARSYFFFAKKNSFQFAWDGKQTLRVFIPSGVFFDFATDKLRVKKISTGRIQEDPRLSGKNEGGVEISEIQDWYVDSGFKTGHSPHLDRRRTSKVLDPSGIPCEISNASLFDYDRRTGDARIKSLSEVVALYQRHCPTP